MHKKFKRSQPVSISGTLKPKTSRRQFKQSPSNVSAKVEILLWLLYRRAINAQFPTIPRSSHILLTSFGSPKISCESTIAGKYLLGYDILPALFPLKTKKKSRNISLRLRLVALIPWVLCGKFYPNGGAGRCPIFKIHISFSGYLERLIKS